MWEDKDNKLIKEIETEVFSIPIIDTHEHLMSEQERRTLDLDIFFLFSHYTSTDLINSSMSEEEYFLSICKQFPNVYFNLCWIHDVSADIYGSILEKVCEVLPSNKVFGFGGDYKLVECIYGAQKTARKVITSFFYKKIKTQYFSFEEGIEYAKKILNKNPMSFYSIN